MIKNAKKNVAKTAVKKPTVKATKKVNKMTVSFSLPVKFKITHISGVLFVLAVLMAWASVHYSSGSRISFAEPLILSENLLYDEQFNEIPERIVVPKISLDLDVNVARVSEDTWETFDDVASFGIGSSYLNVNKGNSVIFAHARNGLFKRLDELSDGDDIYVLSKESWYKYKVFKKLYVYPNEVDFLNHDYGKSVTLFTCYGPQDEKRVVIIGKFIDGKGEKKII